LPRLTELLGKDARLERRDLLVKPFQRERFALAMDRGRVWRKQAIAELEWMHGCRRAERSHAANLRGTRPPNARDGDEAGALVALARERAPEVRLTRNVSPLR